MGSDEIKKMKTSNDHPDETPEWNTKNNDTGISLGKAKMKTAK